MPVKVISLLLLLILSSCATTKDKKESSIAAEGDAKELFEKGRVQIERGNYMLAIEKFEALVSRYPFGPYAQQAQLEIAHAHYKSDEPDIAIAQADDFIKINPLHKHVDYAYYIKGLANFHRFDSMFDSIVPRDFADLDLNPYKQAFLDFKILVTTYSDSRYSPDAEQRMVYLRNILARHELNVANYYMRRGAYVAVANRCEYLLKNYDGSDSIPDALLTLAQAYDKLGLKDSYNDTIRVIELNHPQILESLQES